MLSTPRTGSVVPLTYEQVLEKTCLFSYANIACLDHTAHVHMCSVIRTRKVCMDKKQNEYASLDFEITQHG